MRGSNLSCRSVLSTAGLIVLGMALTPAGAGAENAALATSARSYRIVGALSEGDIRMLWAPAGKQLAAPRPSRNSRRYFRTMRPNSLADWIPEATQPSAGTRLTRDEEKMKLLRGMKDRDGDGTPDKQDVYPWDSTRW